MEDSKKYSISTGGIGFNGALFITFLVLKLTNVIDWSWWWVTAPLWIPAGIVVSIFLLVLAWAVVCAGISPRNDRWI